MAGKIGRNDPCWCGSGRKYKSCHMAFDEKIAKYQAAGHKVPPREIIKTPEQIAARSRTSHCTVCGVSSETTPFGFIASHDHLVSVLPSTVLSGVFPGIPDSTLDAVAVFPKATFVGSASAGVP